MLKCANLSTLMYVLVDKNFVNALLNWFEYCYSLNRFIFYKKMKKNGKEKKKEKNEKDEKKQEKKLKKQEKETKKNKKKILI